MALVNALMFLLEIRALKTKPGAVLTNYDPFDSRLIAQAKPEKYVLLSHDRSFESYGEDCIQRIKAHI